MLKLDIVSIFPGMVRGALGGGHRRARDRPRARSIVAVHDLRDFTTDRHRVVDDVPFGGGPGMVMKPEPFFAAVERIRERPRRAGGDRADDAGWAAVHASRGGAAERAAARRGPVRPLRRRRRSRPRGISRPRSCRSATTWCRAASCRRWSCSTRWRGWCRASSATKSRCARDTFVARAARFSAVHAAGGVSGAGKCRRCCCRGTTRRSPDGGGGRRWRARWRAGRICWRRRRSTTKIARRWTSCGDVGRQVRRELL